MFLYNGDQMDLGFRTFAVAYSHHPEDEIDYTLHKYGEVDFVEKWVENAKSKFISARARDLADALHIVIQKPGEEWPVDLLNRMIDYTGGVKQLVEYTQAIDVETK